MSKGTIVVSVEAETKKASSKIKQLQKELQGSSAISEMGTSFKGVPGLDALGGKLGEIGGIAGRLPALLNPATLGIAAVGGAAVATAKKLDAMIEAGQPALKDFQNLTVTLENLDRNLGGAGRSMAGVAKELQLMSANGVNSVDSLGKAANTLTMAFGGNTSKAIELIRVFDDLAAGTGIQVDDWASMAAEVRNTGVSVRDLTKLSNKGIPIYQALGKAMNVTAEEAEKMAKEGRIGAEEWTAAIKELSGAYKGLSKAMSDKTLSGSRATLEASKSLAYQGAAQGAAEAEIAANAARSERYQREADDAALQAERQIAASNWQGLKERVKDWGESINRIPEFFVGLFTSDAEIEKMVKANAAKIKANFVSAYNDAMSGKLTAGQVDDVIAQLEKLGPEFIKNFGLDHLEDLKNKAKELADIEKQNADRRKQEALDEQKRSAVFEYGTAEQKLSALSGVSGLGDVKTWDDATARLKQLKDALMDATIPNVEEATSNIKLLNDAINSHNQELDAQIQQIEKQRQEEEKLANTRAQLAQATLSEVDSAKRAKESADNNVKRAMENLQMVAYEGQKRKAALEEKGIYDQITLRDKIKGMKNYNEWMALYDEAAASGISRAEWRRQYGKAKKMDLPDIADSAMFKKDTEMGLQQMKEEKARRELEDARKKQDEANDAMNNASKKLGDVTTALGLTEQELKNLVDSESRVDKLLNSVIRGNAMNTRGTAITG